MLEYFSYSGVACNRLNSRSTKKRKLKYSLLIVDVSSTDFSSYTPDVIACAVKVCLSDLRQSILPENMYDRFVEAVSEYWLTIIIKIIIRIIKIIRIIIRRKVIKIIIIRIIIIIICIFIININYY